MLLPDGSDFLIGDITENGNRILIFADTDQLSRLSRCAHVFMDGTFQAAPTQFDSLYTIHGELTENLIVPLVYMLSTTRTADGYKAAFNKLSSVMLEKVGSSFSPRN